MPRGAHEADAALFGASALPSLRAAVSDLSWLLSRGYAPDSALKLVGDRHRLRRRQRMAVGRSACADQDLADRHSRHVPANNVRDRKLAIDGFNVLIVLETALAGGVVLRGRDAALRDLASVHGSYRRIDVTERAISLLVTTLQRLRPTEVTWYLDRPVSNSGRLRGWLQDAAIPGVDWTVELLFDPDRALMDRDDALVASSDAAVLDGCGPWFDLVGTVLEADVPRAWVVDLAG